MSKKQKEKFKNVMNSSVGAPKLGFPKGSPPMIF